MRFKSRTVNGIQIFAVSGTNVVSFGIRATATARQGLLGFAVERTEIATGETTWAEGYKVFRSVIADPTERTKVETLYHPIQSLVWDDFYAQPGQSYEYAFHPFKGSPTKPDLSTPAATVRVDTEPLSAGKHDIYFNRGVTGSQSYAREFHNLSPEDQPTPDKTARAYKWLSRHLDEKLIAFIDNAQSGEAIRGCFYEFTFAAALTAFRRAIDRGVDVQLVVDLKRNGKTIMPTPKNHKTEPEIVPDKPREGNLEAIAKAGLPAGVIIPREKRSDDIQHNKFMVLLEGSRRRPTQLWTGSTNLTTGGVFGQANVGHIVRDKKTAGAFLRYWKQLATDPGADKNEPDNPLNIKFLKAVGDLTPTPTTIAKIPRGITPIFSPRHGLAPLDLYVSLLTRADSMSCGTFPFGITKSWRAQLAENTTGRLVFLLLDKPDNPKKSKDSKEPIVALNSKSNVYKAYGSEIETPIGRWVQETNNKEIGLNTWVSYIHLKFALSDPLGADPVVVTGSANFSPASTDENDENMMIIRGDKRVADIYFTEFNRLWGHYYFRSVVERMKKHPNHTGHDYQYLWETDDWLDAYAPDTLKTKRVTRYIKMSI